MLTYIFYCMLTCMFSCTFLSTYIHALCRWKCPPLSCRMHGRGGEIMLLSGALDAAANGFVDVLAVMACFLAEINGIDRLDVGRLAV